MSPHVSPHLSPDQRAELEAALRRRQQELEQLLSEHHGGLSRSEHARELLTGDSDDVSQREAERELDMTVSDRGATELAEVGAALRRLRDGDYGICEDCDAEVPYLRLKAEPWARCCVACAGKRERARR